MKTLFSRSLFFVGLYFVFTNFIHAHELASSSLELRKNNEIVRAFFKTPINSGRSKIEIVFPNTWIEIASNSIINQKDKSAEYQFVFKIEKGDNTIRIKRKGENTSPLIISVVSKNSSHSDVLQADVSKWDAPFDEINSFNIFKNFTILGIEHILIGFDHLLFVLALLFLVKRKKLIWAISAFTLAHSITLGISTFKIIDLPIGVVEALIAFSIVLLAVEMTKPQEEQNSSKYIQLAFLFGLLHGFGFASVLANLGIPGNNIPLALLSFNIGVEIGQLIFVFAVILTIHFILKNVSIPILSKKLSYPIGGIAAFWFLERVAGLF